MSIQVQRPQLAPAVCVPLILSNSLAKHCPSARARKPKLGSAPIGLCLQALLPRADIRVSARVEFENGWSGIEPRPDQEIDDGERPHDIVATFELLVEHGKVPLDPPMRIGN